MDEEADDETDEMRTDMVVRDDYSGCEIEIDTRQVESESRDGLNLSLVEEDDVEDIGDSQLFVMNVFVW